MDSLSSVLTFVLWFLTGTLCAYFAFQRGRSPYVWFAVGLLFGLLGLLALFIMPTLEVVEEAASQSKKPSLPPPEHDYDYLVKDWFYIDKTGKQQGAVPYESLKKLWAEGSINTSTFVWSEGMDNWKRIGDLPLKDKVEEVRNHEDRIQKPE